MIRWLSDAYSPLATFLRTNDFAGISLAFTIVPLADAGWRTASATGVLSYMDYDHVQH